MYLIYKSLILTIKSKRINFDEAPYRIDAAVTITVIVPLETGIL